MGTTGAPYVTVHGPNNVTIDARPENVGVSGNTIVEIDPAAKATYVIVDQPAAGSWTTSLDADSAPLASSNGATGLPDAQVAGTVTGDGTTRTLNWTLTPIAGQSVQFVESGPDGSKVLTTTTAASGNLSFTPAPGLGGTRDILALVTQDGLPRTSIKVASYTAPARTVLSVTKLGSGSGVVSSPAGISCGPACEADITVGTPLTLTATPSAGSRFTGWSGACAGTSPTCTVTPAQTDGVTATFTKIPKPVVSGFTPSVARPGVSVVLAGSAFTGATRVAFGKVTASVFKVLSDTSVRVTVPTGAVTAAVSVTTGGGVGASRVAFKVLPSITSFTPASAKPGVKVTINGLALAGVTRVTIGGVAARVVSVTWGRLVVLVPATARSGRIVVTTAGGTATSSKLFTVLH